MSQKKIKVAYAYNGLIYLPLLLANTVDSFNAHFELVYTDGDDKALNQLLRKDGCDIAVCDPFAIDNLLKSAKDKSNTQGSIKLIGCLIDKSPIWIYRTDEKIAPNGIKATADLRGERIKIIKGYPYPNTGWIFCKELREVLETPTSSVNIEPVSFNPDHVDQVNDGEILLTSNLLKIAISDLDKVDGQSSSIYSYGCSQDPNEKLNNLFFTGIIAKKKQYQHDRRFIYFNLFFTEIVDAIQSIYNDDLDVIVEEKFEFFKEHTKKYDAQKDLNDDQRKEIFKNIILKLKKEKIYPENLECNPDRYNRMMIKRKEYNPNLTEIRFSDFYDDFVINGAQRPGLFWSRFRNWSRRVYLRLIKPLLNSKFGSFDFIKLIVFQGLPAALCLTLAHFVEEPRPRLNYLRASYIALCISFLVCVIVHISNVNSRHSSKSLKIERFAQRFLETNVAYQIGLLFGILGELFKIW